MNNFNNFNLQSIIPHKNKLSFLPENLLNLLEYHRGLEEFIPEKKEDYYIYSGRGPSNSSFHIGHLPSLQIILEFQKFLQTKIYFMISDDEKIFRDKIDMNIMKKNVDNTLSQLEKIGFNKTNTDIHINSDGIDSEKYKLLIKLMNTCTLNELENTFGKKSHIGEYFYVFYQLLPCFLYNSQCIVIAGVDQEPFFRLGRHIASKLNHPKPIIIYTKNIPGLNGDEKMSTSKPETYPIFLSDNLNEIKKKIMKITQVGAGTLDELFQNGSDLEKDIPFKLIDIFDNNRHNVELIKKAYTIGINETEYELMKNFIDSKGFIKRNKIMITTYGLRLYLINLIDFNIKKYR